MQDNTKIDHGKVSDAVLGDLGRSFDLLHGLVESQVFQHLAGALHDGEMTFSQLNAIYRLYRNGPQTVAEVARGSNLSPTAASRMIERLVQANLVERREDPSDRRQKRIEVTPAGIARLKDLQAVTTRAYQALFSRLPPETLGRLAEVLRELGPHLPTHPLLLGPETSGE